MKWAFANKERLAKQGMDVEKWAEETKGKKLPKVAPKQPKKK